MLRTKPRVHGIVAALGLACVLSVACSSSSTKECRTLPAECSGAAPSYSAEVAPIIAARCATCHNLDDPSGAWPLDNYDDLTDWSSSIMEELRNCSMPPPDSGKSLPESERALIYAWFICGAPEN